MMDRPQFCAGGRCGGFQFLATWVSTGRPACPQELVMNEREREREGGRGKERGIEEERERERREREEKRERTKQKPQCLS